MIIGTIRRILKEDLAKGGGDVPAWAGNLLYPLNQFLEQVTSALRNRLTFKDNFSCIVKTVNVVHDVQKEISVGSALKVSGVVVLDSSGDPVTGFAFSRLSNGNLGVIVKLESLANADTTFLILLG